TSAAAAPHARRGLRVIGLVRDPAGAPVAGAVVWVNLPRQITFTGKDGRFELARPVSDSATLCRPFVTDGAMVTLEMFDGRAYRLVRHGHPDSIAAPGAERAAAIARGLQDAFQAVKLDPARWTPPPVTFHIAGTVRDS